MMTHANVYKRVHVLGWVHVRTILCCLQALHARRYVE